MKVKSHFIFSLLQNERSKLRRNKKRPSSRFSILLNIIALTTLFCLSASPAFSQSPSPKPVPNSPPLRIATRFAKPDAFEENGKIVGFSADIGQSILEQLQRQAEIKAYPDVPELLDAIRSGQADLGIAAIALTSQRDRDFDFSHPILSSELQIMVLAHHERGQLQRLFTALFSTDFLEVLSLLALLMLIPVHLVWYLERNNKELISNPSYLPGIFEALWWTVLTLVGQADEMPKAPVGRIVALFWVLVGIVFITYFTALITSEVTVQELEGSIRNLSDLQNQRVALIAEHQITDYLHEQNIQQVIEFSQPEPAFEALQNREVDAIVAPRPLLLYYASQNRKEKVRIVGTPFREQFYSIVMPKNSPYRRPVNQAILTLKENETYRKIYRKWYGVNPDG